MEIENLNSSLDKLEKISNQEWMQSLNNRKLAELEFHDRDRDTNFKEKVQNDSNLFDKYYGNKKYYKANELSITYIQNWIKENAKDRVFLDYACGNGERALWAAEAGASLSIGLDISSVSVGNARKEAKKLNLNNCRFVQGDCEDTKLPDNSIDAIVCSGMLHHLDLSYAFPELRRILKPGGKILAVEALSYNPAIKLYRQLTPAMRTEWETNHILSLSDVKFASRFFKVNEIKYWHLTSLFAGKFSLKLLPLCNFIDKIFTKIPFIQLLSWIFTFELVKTDSED